MAAHPAFDVTPNRYVTAIVTERGIARAPYEESLRRWWRRGDMEFRPRCLPTAVGSMPHTDPQAACDVILQHMPAIPTWPQLPRRSFRENMYVQFGERFPAWS